jgi:hypothetical protein
VKVSEYRLALWELLQEEACDLIEMMGLSETMADLKRRLTEPDLYSAAGKLTRGILNEVNAKAPMQVRADDFNRGAEKYYRGRLRRQQMEEGLGFLRQDFRELDLCAARGDEALRRALNALGLQWGAEAHLDAVGADLLADRLAGVGLTTMINLALLSITKDSEQAVRDLGERDGEHAAPVYRAR